MFVRAILIILATLWAGCEASTTLGSNQSPDASRGPDASEPTPDAGSSRDASKSDAGRPHFCELAPQQGPCEAYMPRYHFDSEVGACRRFIYGGCEGNDNNFQTLEACAETCSAVQPDPCEVEAVDPSLPGVTVRIRGEHCYVESGEAARFDYEIAIDDDVDYMRPDSGGSCGECVNDWSDPRQVANVGIGNREGIRYCRCDEGCCPATQPQTETLPAGTYEATLDWPGRQWEGPSDTGAPLGEPFPPGNYIVQVHLELPEAGSVNARLPIHVVEGEPPSTRPAGGGEPACQVEHNIYPSGTVGIAHPRLCDGCMCHAGELRCADPSCPVECPQGSAQGKSCSRCGPADACAVVRHGCLPECETDEDCAESGGGLCEDGVCRMLCG